MTKTDKYTNLLVEAKQLLDKEVDVIANMANFTRLITNHFKHHWIGFYRVWNDQLVLGPFNGPIACTTIDLGKGVCGKAWLEKKTLIVNDVHDFEGHIACSPLSNSEIVVPCIKENQVYAVLDIDSTQFSNFDKTDQYYLEQLVQLL